MYSQANVRARKCAAALFPRGAVRCCGKRMCPFDRINLDLKIQIKHIYTKNQLADMLTTGSFTRDEWNHLLCLFNVSHFSSTSEPGQWDDDKAWSSQEWKADELVDDERSAKKTKTIFDECCRKTTKSIL